MSEKIKFYRLDTDEDKAINIDNSYEFSKAMNFVIEKDILKLNDKLKEIIQNVNKMFVIEQISTINIDYNIENIDDVINDIEIKISDLIIKKGNIKIGLFTPNKKQRREEIKRIDHEISKVSKEQNNIISLKDEYIKLRTRVDDINNN